MFGKTILENENEFKLWSIRHIIAVCPTHILTLY